MGYKKTSSDGMFSNPSITLDSVCHSEGGTTEKLLSPLFEKSKINSHLFTSISSYALAACSRKWGYPILKGPNLRFEEASITGSFAAYRYIVQLNSIKLRLNILFQISASKLLTGNMYSTVWAVTNENRATTWPNHQSRIFALVYHDLYLFLLYRKLTCAV